jgi:hypothetical protein
MEHKLGCIPDKYDKRDIPLGAFLDSYAIIQESLDYKLYFDIGDNQGQDPSCVGYGCVAIKEAIDRMNCEYTRLSEIWLYDQAKRRDEEPYCEGTSIRIAMKIMASIGCAPFSFIEEKRPYAFGKYDSLIIPRELTSPFRIKTYARLRNIDEMCRCLAQHGPFAIGVLVTDEFNNMVGPGIIPDSYTKYYGGHCIAVTGYSIPEQTFTIRNSWGECWGDGGFSKLSFNYVDRFMLDAWGIVDVTPNEI